MPDTWPIDKITEFLTVQIQMKKLFEIHVPHPIYNIKGRGFINYCGNGIWVIDDIQFPTDSVNRINPETRVIYLK